MRYLIDPIAQYFDFKGRATRKPYWLFFLIYYILNFLLAFADLVLYETFKKEGRMYGDENGLFIRNIYLLFLVIPAISIAVRRLRDGGSKGWKFIVILIPILNIIMLCRKSRKN
jgi:uncharacterized membrane protein YhaH (DUF805 family)